MMTNGSNLPKCQQTIAEDIEIKIHQEDIKFLPAIFREGMGPVVIGKRIMRHDSCLKKYVSVLDIYWLLFDISKVICTYLRPGTD